MNEDKRAIDHDDYDLVVIGGGIYGAWAINHAAKSNLKCLLVEKNDFASATSMASSKLIHGGLRYLENFEFKLVRKSLLERRRLFDISPHSIKPLRFVVPIHKNSRVRPWKLKIGLWFYDLLASKNNIAGKHQSHDKLEFSKISPNLISSELNAIYSYGDCQTDDARFVNHILNDTNERGCKTINYMSANKIHLENGHHHIELIDQSNNQEYHIKSRCVLICAGPWTEQWLPQTEGKVNGRIRLTQGIHLVVPQIDSERAYLLQSPKDGRFFFIIPWYKRTLIGTTDVDRDLDQMNTINQEDIDYLITSANHFFKDKPFSSSNIISTFSGLRVLERDDSDHPSSNSREWQCLQTEPGRFISIGGKYTSAREDAQVAITNVCNFLNVPPPPNKTISLESSPEIEYSTWKAGMKVVANELALSADIFNSLIFRYGKHIKDIFDLLKENNSLSQLIHKDLPFIYAELIYCCENENIIHLEDLLRRRIPLMILAEYDEALIRDCAEMAAKTLNWNEVNKHREIESCRELWINNSLLS